MSGHRQHSLRQGWIASLFQFAGGAALAIGILGIARGGRDLWLGIALIVLAALFGLRSVALDEERREQETKRLLDDFKREIVAQLPDPNLGAFRTPPPGRIRRWLRYLAG